MCDGRKTTVQMGKECIQFDLISFHSIISIRLLLEMLIRGGKARKRNYRHSDKKKTVSTDFIAKPFYCRFLYLFVRIVSTLRRQLSEEIQRSSPIRLTAFFVDNYRKYPISNGHPFGQLSECGTIAKSSFFN